MKRFAREDMVMSIVKNQGHQIQTITSRDFAIDTSMKGATEHMVLPGVRST
ncbi:hypothetical protein PIB30_073684 [Stylosanthes scabra]|uniref:Uncharacterized protein n=1 Tax=Stylosanthes scabra TaxID=79078 RepID=A0ABU6SPN1_9FABA|nr:hypothetical protein [Stylosanthes scabra]